MTASAWAPVRLGDLLHVEHGWPFRSSEFAVDDGKRPIVISIGNFDYSGGFRFDSSTIRTYTGTYPDGYEAIPGEIYLVMTCQTSGGEILGIPARIPDDGRIYLHNQRIGHVVIDAPENLSPDFFYYWALTPAFNNQLFASASGTKILHTSPGRVTAASINLPPLAVQQCIAKVLSALDDKIVSNYSIRTLTDELCSASFQRLSVNRDLAELSSIALVNASSIGPKTDGTLRYFDISTVGRGNYSFPEKSEWSAAPGRARRALRTGDTIWSTVRPNRRSHALVLDEDSSLVASTGLTVLTPLDGKVAGLYESCRTDQFVEYLESVAEGSAYPAVRADRFNNAPVPALLAEEWAEFERFALPLRQLAHAAGVESRNLAATRDELLPLLMSGKIRVRDAERQAEDVL